jgi:hypothetical protein
MGADHDVPPSTLNVTAPHAPEASCL